MEVDPTSNPQRLSTMSAVIRELQGEGQKRQWEDARRQNQRNTQKDSEKTARPTTAAAGQNSGGYGNLHGKKYWARNPTENKIICTNAVRFDKGPHFNAKTAAKEPQCEVCLYRPDC
ncbi:hypothetical protein V8E54_010460 [Elaphomyces granulatus]